MTDDPLDDAALDDQIRAGVRALADEAPTPPDLPTSRPGTDPATVHQLGHPLALVAAAAAIVLLVAGAAIVVTRTEDTTTVRANSTTTTTVPDRSLYGVRWVAESAVVDGEETTFPSDKSGTPTIVFDDAFDCLAGGGCMAPDGTAFFFYDGCNSGSGGMEIEGTTIRVSRMGSTLMGCGRSYSPFRRAVEEPEAVTTFEITGDRLTMTGPDGSVITYRAAEDPLPEPEGTVLVEDMVGEVAYRITWQADESQYTMVFDRGIKGSADSNVVLLAQVDSPVLTASKANIWSDALVYGMVPSTATTLTYVPSKTDPVDVELLPLDGGSFQAFATLVPSGDQDWTLIATDADGNEIDRYTGGTGG